jgi:hypothetical protein
MSQMCAWQILMKVRYVVIVLLTLASASIQAGPQRREHRDKQLDAPAADAREQALRRAQVWNEPVVPIGSARLADNPAGSEPFSVEAVVPCRFKPAGVGGSTPKFDCELESGEKVRVKYGRGNAEVFAEVIATRLLSALGFATDHMYTIDRVRCFGCPEDPFSSLQCLNDGSTVGQCFPAVNYSQVQDFETAVIERQITGRRIERRHDQGWSWKELTKIDPQAGGAPRAHVDALRLMAVFMSHWDNKAKNQRLVCLDARSKTEKTTDKHAKTRGAIDCARPLVVIQDLGGTFGPFKLDLEGWKSTPVWADSATCRVSMRALPYGGSTFPDINISEPGRVFLAQRLGVLTPAQVRNLFEGAGLWRYTGHRTDEAKNIDNWVNAFEEKVRAIVDHPGCPN